MGDSVLSLRLPIFSVVKTLVCALLGYAAWAGLPFGVAIPFALLLLVASVPGALSGTFTLKDDMMAAAAQPGLDLRGAGL
jgi:hypothetical protein